MSLATTEKGKELIRIGGSLWYPKTITYKKYLTKEIEKRKEVRSSYVKQKNIIKEVYEKLAFVKKNAPIFSVLVVFISCLLISGYLQKYKTDFPAISKTSQIYLYYVTSIIFVPNLVFVLLHYHTYLHDTHSLFLLHY